MNKTVLIVDDEIAILEPLSMLLELEGFNVVTTTNGEETRHKIFESQPDIVLLDILMSGSDGRVICKQLKTDKDTQHLPIILMSAHPTAKEDSGKAGADGFIAKPFETDTLLKTIETILSR